MPHQAAINKELYGVEDVDALIQEMNDRVAHDRKSMTPIVLDMITEATETAAFDPVAAKQTLRRTKLLIMSCCPLLKDPVTDDHCCDQ